MLVVVVAAKYNITGTPLFFISTLKLIKLQPFWCIIFIKISLEEGWLGWRCIILFLDLIGPTLAVWPGSVMVLAQIKVINNTASLASLLCFVRTWHVSSPHTNPGIHFAQLKHTGTLKENLHLVWPSKNQSPGSLWRVGWWCYIYNILCIYNIYIIVLFDDLVNMYAIKVTYIYVYISPADFL